MFVLDLAVIELVVFALVGMVLCFGFLPNTGLMIKRCFYYC